MDSLSVPGYNDRPRSGSRDSFASSQFSGFSEVSSITPSTSQTWASEHPSSSSLVRYLLLKRKDIKSGVFPNEHEERHRQQIDDYLITKYYSYAKAEKLILPWDKLLEVYIFGDELRNNSNEQLWNSLLNHHQESGQFQFRTTASTSPSSSISNAIEYLNQLVTDLSKLDEILDLYSKPDNWMSDKLFEAFYNFNENMVVPIPMSITLFADYMVSIKHANSEFYMNHLFKLIRLLWYIYLLHQRKVLEPHIEQMDTMKQITLNKFLSKDNNTSLGLSLLHLGEFFQVKGDINSATNIWEISAHLTRDPECCQMAVWGLSDGYGSGNKYKLLNKLGKKTKTNKYNTKRRIAQLYRIANEKNKKDIGVSWVWKDKYD